MLKMKEQPATHEVMEEIMVETIISTRIMEMVEVIIEVLRDSIMRIITINATTLMIEAMTGIMGTTIEAVIR